jgi:uncharacterized membrane protein
VSSAARKAAARTSQLRERVRSAFWLIPSLCCSGALALGIALPELDQLVADDLPFLFAGGPDGARSLLSSIATSMISFTGLVFSITVVSLQLASGQFSPRVLRSFLRSRVTQTALGVFIATALYALVVLRSVRGNVGVEPYVPQLAVTTAAALLVVSFVLFIAYISHITRSLQLSTIVENVRRETVRLLGDGERSAAGDERGQGLPLAGLGRWVAARRPGHLVGVDVPSLVAEAARCDVQLVVAVPLGAHLAEGMPLVAVHGEGPARVDDDRLRRFLPLGGERTMAQDVAFGFRQLVDIAEKALSPGINDPTTAVQALDALHDLLRRLAARPDPASGHVDDAGTLRLRTRERGFAGYLDLALDEVLRYGADSVQVVPRVRGLLEDLLTAALPEHLPAVQAKLAALPPAPLGRADR